MKDHDPDILTILQASFRKFVDDILDDPAWITAEAPEFVAKLRKAAEWLGEDFDAILSGHFNRYEAERLLRLEHGEKFPEGDARSR